MDIINFSLAKDDSYTVIYGLQTIKEHFIPIIENNDIEIKKRRDMFKTIVFDLYSFGLLAVNKRDEKSANETINTINSIVTVIIGELKVIQMEKSKNGKNEKTKLDVEEDERSMENIIADPIYAFRNIGKVAIEKELRETSASTIKVINEICLEMISLKSISNAMIATNALGSLGMLSLENELDYEVLTVIDNLMDIQKLSSENKLNRVTETAIHHHDKIRDKNEIRQNEDLEIRRKQNDN